MRAHDLATHGEMAVVLGVDRTLVTKYVSGARHCHDVTQLRRFAEVMDLPAETFGLLPDPHDASSVDGPPGDEANEWCLVRRTLNRNRSELTAVAARLYWDPVRIEDTACITLPGWMPTAPVEQRQRRRPAGAQGPRPEAKTGGAARRPPVAAGAGDHGAHDDLHPVRRPAWRSRRRWRSRRDRR
jgi:hypothetical protein